MDKDLVNNQIILMRKIVRNVKRFVKQKLNKQIKKLELRLNKKIEKSMKKLENKIKNKKKELIAINGVNVDEVSKQSLIENEKHFEDIIKSGKTLPEEKALARIAINQQIVKVVNKFKEENPNCDQWLPSQIQLWQQKKLIKKNKILKKKGFFNNEIEENNNEENEPIFESKHKTNSNSMKDSEISESNTTKKSTKKTKTKKVEDIQQLENQKEIQSKDELRDETENKFENNKTKSDPFFLSDNISEEEEEEEDNSNDQRISHKNQFRNEKFRPNDKMSKFSKPFDRNSISFQNKKNLKPKKFENKSFPSKANIDKITAEDLHPSWRAKRMTKDKIKIDLNQRPIAKKIRFSDQ